MSAAHPLPSPEVLTPEEAAGLLRIKVKTLVRKAAAGEVPGACKVFRHWRFNRLAILSMAPQFDVKDGSNDQSLPARNEVAVELWHEGQQHCRIRPTKREALRAAEELLEELKAETGKDNREAPTFYDYCLDKYAPDAKDEELAEATYRNRRYTIRTLVKHFGTLKLDAITDEHVKTFRKERRKEGCLPSTINDDVKVLKRILNHARGQKDERNQKKYLVATIEIAPLPEPKTKGHARAWTTAEIERLFAAIGEHSPDILPMVVFGLNTGCRKTEIIRLRWSSIHWDTKQISIEPNEEWRPKSNKARTVPLSDTLAPWLRQLQREREKLPAHKHSDFVFVGGRQKRPLRFWPQNRFDRARKAAALEGGPHTMRHTYASHFLAGGGSLFRLGRILGHSNTIVTERYSHMLPGALEEEGDRVSIAPGIGPATSAAQQQWKAGAR